MPDLLLELFSEEIPARMQRQAADDLRRLVTDGLVGAGLTYDGAKAFATPRRLALTVHGVTARSADLREEKKGPRVGAPQKAIEGFLRGAGLSSIDQAKIQSDPKKGDFYVAVMERPGRAAEEIVAEVVPAAIRDFPWPKSMRWGARSAPPDSPLADGEGEGAASLRWVRPLRSILCTFGPETEEPIVVPIEVGGVAAGNVTAGHRFMSEGAPIAVRRFDDYVAALEAARVVLDGERRKAIIEAEAKNLAFAQGLEVVDDPGLLEETAGLVEWPVVLMGSFDEDFLDIPDEVIRLTIRQNQKCFVLRGTVPPPSETGEGQGEAHPSRLSSRFGRQAETGTHSHGDQMSVSDGYGSRTGADAPSGMTEGDGGASKSTGSLTNRFLLVANIEASDGGKSIVAGNERVIAARLADARFFWEQDRKVPLEAWGARLDGVTFHEKLGSQRERVERIARLAREIAPLVGADPDDVEQAARLAKADLTTAMVGEFPELQGVMGRYYFLAENDLPPVPTSPSDLSSRFGRQAETGTHTPSGQLSGSDGYGSRTGADAPSGMTKREGSAGISDARLYAIADAIRDHYKPQGPNESLPSAPVSVSVALADKLDTLVGFWAIDEKPTGSKDPYALRRAALGVIRNNLQNDCRIPLRPILTNAIERMYLALYLRDPKEQKYERYKRHEREEVLNPHYKWPDNLRDYLGEDEYGDLQPQITERVSDLLSFFADRLKVHLRDTGARHDLIDAVFAAGAQGAPSSPHGGEGGARSAPGEGAAKKESPSPASDLRSSATSPRGGEEGSSASTQGGRSSALQNDDLLMIVRRVEALGNFLDTDDGANLLVGYRRAANILRDEEKKDGAGAFDDPPDHHLIEARGEPEERALFHVMQAAEAHARQHVEAEDFEGAMRALAELRPAVDAFFDHVTVNADDPELRRNRLKLLNMLRRATLAVADFSKIGG